MIIVLHMLLSMLEGFILNNCNFVLVLTHSSYSASFSWSASFSELFMHRLSYLEVENCFPVPILYLSAFTSH